jgi:hypothetical protein
MHRFGQNVIRVRTAKLHQLVQQNLEWDFRTRIAALARQDSRSGGYNDFT